MKADYERLELEKSIFLGSISSLVNNSFILSPSNQINYIKKKKKEKQNSLFSII